MRHKFFIENTHLVRGSVRHYDLSDPGQLPVVQLFHQPVRDIDRGVAVREGDATQDKGLALPIWRDIIWNEIALVKGIF